MATIEGLCNQALDVIGYTRHIGNIYDGSKAARMALDLWGQTRDALLEQVHPDWSLKDGVLVLLKSAPNIVNGFADYTGIPWNTTYPPLPWLYEYEYPADCIDPMQIKNNAQFLPVWRPRPKPFRLTFDNSMRVIVTNQPSAILTYVSQVLDPDDWHEGFKEMMIMTLAKKFEAELAPQRMQMRQQQQQRQDGDNPS